MFSPFTPEFIERQRLALVNRMIELREELSRKPDVDDGEPGDLGDRASVVSAAATDASLAMKKLAELADIDAALTRIQNGSYGICEATGKPISQERLEVFPAARYSILIQQKVEKRHRRF